jgi:cell division protein FtsI/penicillin-binding protein 2
VIIKNLLASYLSQHPNASMAQILSWAMSRKISANANSKFLTGESWHQFHNYKTSDDHKKPNLWQMTAQSINLSFVRLMRDVVDYYIDQQGFDKVAILTDKKNRTRQDIINNAVAQEEVFYAKGLEFWIKNIQESLGKEAMSNPQSMTNKTILLHSRKIISSLTHYQRLKSWFKRISYHEKAWLLARIAQSKNISSIKSINKLRIEEQRIIQQTSKWLRNSQSWTTKTVYTHMERLAFSRGVTPAWKRLGYPFNVSPSYAVVLGSSGDTPMSLIELAGTLLNDGLHEQNLSAIERIILAPNSEFETPFKLVQQQQRLIPEAVSNVVRKAMSGVLHKGTAIFASRHPLMKYVQASGAKTGTGDNRYNDIPINRSAAVLSILDAGKGKEKYAICITMSVVDGNIAHYNFTSRVPVRILSRIADHLSPVITQKSPQELRIMLAQQKNKKQKLHSRISLSSSDNNDQKVVIHPIAAPVANIAKDSDQLFKNLF